MKIRYLLIVIFSSLVVGIGISLVKSESVNAQLCNPAAGNPTNTFPRPATGVTEPPCTVSDTFLWLSDYYAGSTVQVPTANIRIFYNINDVNSAPFNFDTITFETLSTGNHRCGSHIRITLVQTGGWQDMWRNPAAGCAIQMPPGIPIDKSMLQSNTTIYGQDLRFIDLNLQQLTADSNAPIRIVSSYPQAMITLRENGVNALWTYSGVGNPDITYTMYFQPDCRYNVGDVFSATLSWFDADWGAPPQFANVFIMYLIDETTGGHVTPPGGLRSDSYPFGGDDTPGSWTTNLTGGHRYKWVWQGIVRSNGLQVSMPFSEINSTTHAVCQQPPSGSFGMSCQAGTGLLTITANASDPDNDQLTIVADVNGAGSDPPNYNGGGANGIFIGNVNRAPDGSTYTVTGTVTDSAGNSAAMSPASATCSQPAATYTCTANTVPAGPFEVGERFTLEISINASGSSPYSSPINSSTHPVSISVSPGMNGVNAASETGYTISPWPGTAVASDYNIYSDTPDTYNFTVSVGGQNCPTAAVVVGLKSYMKIFGGEVAAGGGFGATCAPARGGIYAWARPTGGWYAGASAQLSVTSLLEVNDFYSASNRAGGNTFPPKGITFANDNALTWGGAYGSASCITDYYTSTRDTTLASGNWNGNTAASLSSGRHQYTLSAATIANAGTITIPTNTQAAVYVSGDVFIRNNIVFGAAGGTWQTSPNFVLVVNGDIRIAQDVTRLDGLYIAQGGTIYTCVSSVNTLYDASSVYSNCQNQLSINGGLIGTDIRWLRLRGTLKDAIFQEKPNFANASGTPAGEVINYSPQVWLAPSPLKIPGTPDGEVTTGTGPYDSIKELPPIF